MKKIILLTFFILFFSVFFLDSSLVFANNNDVGLEVEYPEIGEFRPTSLDSGGFPEYIRYISQFLIIIAGIVAFGSFAYGGFLKMTSAGEPLKEQKSKSRIISSLAGLIIVLSSYLFLNAIDPRLVTLEQLNVSLVDDIHSPGIYLSKDGNFYTEPHQIEERRENVRRLNSSEGGLGSLQGEIQAIRIVNPTEDEEEDGEIVFRYLVVLHGEENFRGECEIYITSQREQTFSLSPEVRTKLASISVARTQREDEDPYGGVVAYDKTEFSRDANSQRLDPTDNLTGIGIEGIWSIDIDGAYGIVLASGENWNAMANRGEECVLFTTARPITSLYGHYMNRCEPFWLSTFFAAYDSCTTHYALFPLYR